MNEEEAIITTEGDAKVDEEPIEIINAEEEVEEEEEEEEEYSEEEYIQATRYSFEIKPDHYIFDFKEFESEDEEIEEEEEEMEDEGDLDDEDDNDKDGMEEDGPIDEEMTDQQRVCVILLVDVQAQAEREAKEAVEKNITRRMGWFDKIRRLERKVVNG